MLQAKLDYINLYPCDPGFTTSERVFTFPYLLYVHQGKGQFKIGSATYPGVMGDLFFCPAGVGNTIRADAEDPFLLTGIDFRITGGSSVLTGSQTCLEMLPPRLNILANPFQIALIKHMIGEYQTGRIGGREICDALLAALLLALVRDARSAQTTRSDVQAAMLDYLQNNRSRLIDSAEMARIFAYHRSSINRIMTAATGLSLREYQIAARIRMASELLAYSNRPLHEIAGLCGYGSPIFFSRQFKEKTGQSPREYRLARQHGEAGERV